MSTGSSVACVALALHNGCAMLRRALLVAALLAPAAGWAQTVSLTVSPPGPFGKAACVAAGNANDPALSLSWTVAPPSGSVLGTGWTYQVVALTGGGCSTAPAQANVVNTATIQATLPTGSYPAGTTDTLHLSDLVTHSGASCTATTDQTITLCVQLLNGGSVSTSVSATVTVQLGAPSIPVGVGASPGDSALNVSWADGTDSTVAATSYRVEASPLLASCVGAIPSPLTVACLDLNNSVTGTTSNHSLRLGGLTNGVAYGVRVYATSSGGNDSDPSSPPVLGTPQPTRDFWGQYVSQGGTEQGGCAGGPAGLVSLLAVAGLLLTFRRRS